MAKPLMKALQITGPETFSVIEIEIPVPKDHEVLVEIEIVATCPRWDIHMMAGRDMFDAQKSPQYPLYPGFPGHEAAGTVRAVGAGVKDIQVGARVAALEHDLRGNGAYAQFITYQESDVLLLTEKISFKQAVSFELLKCVYIGMTQFDDVRGRKVVVSGLGPAGILAMQIAKMWGASEVVGIDLSEQRLEYVRSLNIGDVVHAGQLGDRRFDFGYDCVGFAASVQNVLNHTDQHVVIFGVLKGEVKYGSQLWSKSTKLESYKYRKPTPRDRELLLDLIANKGLNTECIQTHHVPFTRYQEAVDLLKSQQAIKVHFYPQKDFQE